MKRIDGRTHDQLRPLKITTGYQSFAEGSVLIELGRTKVVCSVSVEERVPNFLRGSGTGWITAEYSMLPRATTIRTLRDSYQGRISGRSQEIQRLVGRSLRAVTDLAELGERTLIVDCDVLQADGSTRAAAITGSYVAVYKAIQNIKSIGLVSINPLKNAVAAVSVGVVHNRILLDLCYDEDCNAEVDFNIVMNSKGEFVEVQGTAETKPYSNEVLNSALSLAKTGLQRLFDIQKSVLEV